MEANENIDKAKEDYLAGMKYKDIASKYDVSLSTVKSWKTRYKWNRKKGMQTKQKSTRTKSKSMHTKRIESYTVINDDLSDRQREFCYLFLQYHNAAQAYAQVYDCSYHSAMSNSSRLMRNDKIKSCIDELRSESSNELHADLNDVIKMYLKILGSDISNYLEMHSYKFTRLDDEDKEVLDDDGKNVIDCYTTFSLKEPDKQDWSVVKSVHQGKDGLVLETYDKMKAAKELINLLPQGKTSKQTDPVVKAVSDSMKNSVNNDDIEE